MKDGLLHVRSFAFALRTIKLHRFLVEQHEYTLSKQWHRLFRESENLDERLADLLIEDCEELEKLLAASMKTSKRSLNNGIAA